MEELLIITHLACVFTIVYRTKKKTFNKSCGGCVNYAPHGGISNLDRIEELTEILLEDFSSFNKEDLIQLLDLSTKGWWYWNIETGYDYLSKGWCEQLGYSQHDLPHHVDTWFEVMHPEDRDKASHAMNKHLLTGEPYELVARYKHKDGHYVTLRDIGKVIKYKQGKPFIMIGHETEIDNGR